MRITTLDPGKIRIVVSLVQQHYPNWSGFSDPRFQEDEVHYKRTAAAQAGEILGKAELYRLIGNAEYDEVLNRLETVAKATNLLRLQPPGSDLAILSLPELDKPSFSQAILDLLHGIGHSHERIGRFSEYLAARKLPNRWPIPTYFLSLLNPESDIFIKPEPTRRVLTLLGSGKLYDSKPSPETYSAIQQVALQLKDALAEYGPRDMIDVQGLIYVAHSVSKSKEDIRYWKISPGENAWQWEECRDGGFIALGWDELGDVSQMSKGEFTARAKELEKQLPPDWTAYGASQLWTFAQINEGDRIVANRGQKEVVGIGTVTGPYYFVPGVRQGHRLPVTWDDLNVRKVDGSGWTRTLIPLKREKFEEIATSEVVEVVANNRVRETKRTHAPYGVEQCAAETGIDVERLEHWIRAINRKGQAIIYGPPGTGKTFLAERLARHLIGGDDGFVDLVQFHPAYSYEDFVQGIRPLTRPDGGLDYPLVQGRFLEFCARARSVDGLCVLIVDEINRANLARVFGELMYLLEYRGSEVPLASGGAKFSIPPNARLIGTMNTADRSIALVDHALRRRFAFLPLRPDYELLRRYHKKTGFEADGLIDTLVRINSEIGDVHYELGISFFLHPQLEDHIEDIWRMEIEPYLEEFFFDQPEKVENFRWSRIEKTVLA